MHAEKAGRQTPQLSRIQLHVIEGTDGEIVTPAAYPDLRKGRNRASEREFNNVSTRRY